MEANFGATKRAIISDLKNNHGTFNIASFQKNIVLNKHMLSTFTQIKC